MDKFTIKRPLPNPQNELAFFFILPIFPISLNRGHLFLRIGGQPRKQHVRGNILFYSTENIVHVILIKGL